MPGIPASVDPKAEFFATPPELAIECSAAAINLFRMTRKRFPGACLEPSAGDGAFVRALSITMAGVKGFHVDAIDIRDTSRACLDAGAKRFRCGDFRLLGAEGYDLVLGNPPFSQAAEHVHAALGAEHRGRMVAFLLRLAFLCSDARKAFWEAHPLLYLVPIRQRPCFTGRTSDNSDYGLFVWDNSRSPLDARLLSAIDWR